MRTFFATWIAFWLFVTAIAWFCNPGSDFRIMAGNDVVVMISFFIGWIPALYAALNPKPKKA